GDRQATIEGSQPEHKRCAYKLNPGTKTEAAGTIATMSIITMVVSLTASLISGPISDKMHTHKVPVIIASLLFAIGTAMPWIMPSVTGMYLYAGIAGFGYGVYSAIDQALNVDVLPNKEEAGKGLGILNLATTLGQAVGPTITSVVKTTTGTYTPDSPSPSSWPCALPCSCCVSRR
ncbi:MFS transporter, partial [Bifidobacterium longum]|nr:MFS transporter [Bifidobacterium longum]MDB6721235.1 MFS transporter [Bifidobacterium longum]